MVHYGLLIPRTNEVILAFAYERCISHMSILNYAKVYRGEVYPVWAWDMLVEKDMMILFIFQTMHFVLSYLHMNNISCAIIIYCL